MYDGACVQGKEKQSGRYPGKFIISLMTQTDQSSISACLSEKRSVAIQIPIAKIVLA